HPEVQVRTVGDAGGDEVLEHLVLGVEPHGPADEAGEVDAVAAAVEAQFDAVVPGPLGVDAGVDPGSGEQVDGALFEDPGADGALDLVAFAGLHDDGVDALGGEEVGEGQAGRARADDRDLGSGLVNVHGVNGTRVSGHSPERYSVDRNIRAIMCGCRSLVRMTAVR